MRVRDSILELVGNTPLVRLRAGIPANGPQAFVKLEYANPTGSVKDRMALHIIRKGRGSDAAAGIPAGWAEVV